MILGNPFHNLQGIFSLRGRLGFITQLYVTGIVHGVSQEEYRKSSIRRQVIFNIISDEKMKHELRLHGAKI